MHHVDAQMLLVHETYRSPEISSLNHVREAVQTNVMK